MDTFAPNLILLDLMLPGIDGYQVCREVRSSSSVPIIMLSAKGEIFDKVLGLELGADDYMEKPFDSKELVARVKAVLRRCEPRQTERLLRSDGLTMNLDQHKVTVDGKNVALTYKEFELLRLFLQNPGIAFTRDQLFDKVWGQDFYGETRTIELQWLPDFTSFSDIEWQHSES